MAGLPISLTERELFNNPSALARLCAAWYHLAEEANTNLWHLVRKSVYGFTLAVTRSQRLLYADRLYVYGKQRTYTTSRIGQILDQSKASVDNPPYDLFEPMLVNTALRNEECNLGSLIFGRDLWQKIAVNEQLSSACLRQDDPLTTYFSLLSSSETFIPPNLHPQIYDTLDGGSLKARWFETNAYRLADNMNAWTIIPFENQSSTHISPIYGDARLRLTLNHLIMNTNQFCVGPLDFCGVAKIELAQGGGTPIIFVCEQDPRMSQFYLDKHSHSQKYKTSSISTVKKPKRAALLSESEHDNDPTPSGSVQPPKRRRRRLMGDDLMMKEAAIILNDSTRLTRNKRREQQTDLFPATGEL